MLGAARAALRAGGRRAHALAHLETHGVKGAALGQYSMPTYATPLPDGALCVADTGNSRLVVVADEPAGLRAVRAVAATPATGADRSESIPFCFPCGLASDARHLYVADSGNHRIVKLRLPDMRTVGAAGVWGRPVDGALTLMMPDGLALEEAPPTASADADGTDATPPRRLFVSDYGNDRVVALDSQTLTYLYAFGEKGEGFGQFNQPRGIATHGDEIYVADSRNHRVQVFTLDGEFTRAIGFHGDAAGCMRRPHGVAFSRGILLVGETLGNRVHVFTADGEAIRTFEPPPPTAPDPDPEGDYESDPESLEAAADRRRGAKRYSGSSAPTGVCALGGRVFVCDEAFGAVHVLSIDADCERPGDARGGAEGRAGGGAQVSSRAAPADGSRAARAPPLVSGARATLPLVHPRRASG